MIEHALALARRGLHVFPCRPRDKLPATARGCKDAVTDPAVIEMWWRQDPNYNIAIATGAASHIFVLDIDDTDAESVLRQLEAEHGALPATVESITSRGRHLFFNWPNRPVRNSAGKIAPGLDIRGTGGYVLAPPSWHPSGRRYAWSVDSANTFAPAPAWLLSRITSPTNGNGTAATTPPSEWRDLVRDGVSEGQRNNAIARLAGYLLRRRVDAVVVLGLLISLNRTQCRPALDDSEVASIVDSIAGRELERRGLP